MMEHQHIHGMKFRLCASARRMFGSWIGRMVCLVALATFVSDATEAQPVPWSSTELDLIDRTGNTIQQRGDSTGFAAWNGRLDELVFKGQGRLNVVHIGGSHIQADIWSQEMRHRMQTAVPGVSAGRGLIFPFTVAKTNNPWWYKVESTGNWSSLRSVVRTDTSTIGLAGIMVGTTDTLSEMKVSFRTDLFPGHVFNRVKVLHRMDSSYTVNAFDPDSTVMIRRTVNVADGYTEFHFDRYMDTLRLRFHRTDTTQRRFTLYGILLEGDDPGIVYHAVGVNGASTASYLRCQRFVPDLALLKPDLVIFSVGVNDAHDSEFSPARFKRNYVDLIARVRQVAPDAAILLTTNSDSYFKRRIPNKKGATVREVMLELSAEQNVAVWDLYSVMGGLGSIAQWHRKGLAQKDRIHFNRQGYILLGDLMFEALMENYAEHLKRTVVP